MFKSTLVFVHLFSHVSEICLKQAMYVYVNTLVCIFEYLYTQRVTRELVGR